MRSLVRVLSSAAFIASRARLMAALFISAAVLFVYRLLGPQGIWAIIPPLVDYPLKAAGGLLLMLWMCVLVEHSLKNSSYGNMRAFQFTVHRALSGWWYFAFFAAGSSLWGIGLNNSCLVGTDRGLILVLIGLGMQMYVCFTAIFVLPIFAEGVTHISLVRFRMTQGMKAHGFSAFFYVVFAFCAAGLFFLGLQTLVALIRYLCQPPALATPVLKAICMAALWIPFGALLATGGVRYFRDS